MLSSRNFKQKVEKYLHEQKAIIYVDESGFTDESPRTQGYGAAKKGQGCFFTRPSMIGEQEIGLSVT